MKRKRSFFFSAIVLLVIGYLVFSFIRSHQDEQANNPEEVEEIVAVVDQEENHSLNEIDVLPSDVEPVVEPLFSFPIIYTVKPGDTLTALSEHYYQTIQFVTLLSQYNQMDDPSKLFVGKQLTIPAEDELLRFDQAAVNTSEGDDHTDIDTGTPSTSEFADWDMTTPQSYIVKLGDTLSSISEWFYQSFRMASYIAEANGIENTNTIKIGDEIIIPPHPDKVSEVSETTEPPSQTEAEAGENVEGDEHHTVDENYAGDEHHTVDENLTEVEN